MPPVSRPELDAKLSEYLGIKSKEREDGNTNEAIRKLLETLATGLHNHIEDDKREFKQINETLSSHGSRLTTLEAKAAVKPITSDRVSISPPSATDTGSFKIPPVQWAQITELVDGLQQDKITAAAVEVRLTAANKKLTDRVTFVLVCAGGVITILGAISAVVIWGAQHIH